MSTPYSSYLFSEKPYELQIYEALKLHQEATQISTAKKAFIKAFPVSPAVQFNCKVTLTSNSTTTSSVGDSITLWSFTAVDQPYADMKFTPGAAPSFLATPTYEPPTNVSISYWDLYQWPVTQRLYELYSQQFDTDGLLKTPLAPYDVVIQFSTLKRSYSRVAINKPKPQSASSSAGLLSFSWEFSYQDYTEEFTNSAPITPNLVTTPINDFLDTALSSVRLITNSI